MYKTTTTPFGKSYINSLIDHRFLVAYQKPIIEAFFYPSIYIYTRGSLRKFNVDVTRGSQRVKVAQFPMFLVVKELKVLTA